MIYNMTPSIIWLEPGQMINIKTWVDSSVDTHGEWFWKRIYVWKDYSLTLPEEMKYKVYFGVKYKPEVKRDNFVCFNDGQYRHTVSYRVVLVSDDETSDAWQNDTDFCGEKWMNWDSWDEIAHYKMDNSGWNLTI